MKNITWNKVKTTVKDWQVGDYIRQTSIVVIGVLITFVGSELVTQNSEKKDIQATMSLIRDELKSNRENYKSIVSEFREDERLSSLLVEPSDDTGRFIDTVPLSYGAYPQFLL